MSTTVWLPRGMRLVALLVACTVLAFISMMRSSSSKISAKQDPDPTAESVPIVKTLARGFRFVSISGSRQEGYQLGLRNEYDKGITAFDIGFLSRAGVSAMIRDLIHYEKVILPGDTWTEWQPYQPNMDKASLTILGVVFEDGTGDGRPKSVEAIKGRRLGQKMQLARFQVILDSALESSDNELSTALDRLESEASRLQVKEDPSLSEYIKGALHGEKERLLSDIRQMKERKADAASLRKELAKFRDDNERKRARLTRNATDSELISPNVAGVAEGVVVSAVILKTKLSAHSGLGYGILISAPATTQHPY